MEIRNGNGRRGSSGLDVKKIKITINKKSITFLLNGHTSNFPLE